MHSKQRNLFWIAGIAIILIGALAWTAGAVSSRPPAQPTAVAVVDLLELFNGLNEREVLEGQLNARMEGRKNQLDEVVNELKVLEDDIQMLTRGTDEHREKLREGMEKQAVLQARQEALGQIVSIDMGTVRAGLFSKIESAVNSIAEREGFDIVLLDDSKFPIPENASDNDVYRAIITKSVIYRHDSIDITQRVITLMNNEYSAP